MPKFNNFSPVIRLGAILGILRDLLPYYLRYLQ